MRVLLLSATDVRKALRMRDAIGIVEGAFAEFVSGGVDMPQRPVISVAEHGGASFFMPCYLPEMGTLAVKAVNAFKRNPAVGNPFLNEPATLTADFGAGKPPQQGTPRPRLGHLRFSY